MGVSLTALRYACGNAMPSAQSFARKRMGRLTARFKVFVRLRCVISLLNNERDNNAILPVRESGSFKNTTCRNNATSWGTCNIANAQSARGVGVLGCWCRFRCCSSLTSRTSPTALQRYCRLPYNCMLPSFSTTLNPGVPSVMLFAHSAAEPA